MRITSKWRRLARRFQQGDALASVGSDRDLRAHALDQLGRDLLVDLVVLEQQHPQAVRTGCPCSTPPPLAAAVSALPGLNSVTSVSTSIDFVTGFSRKPSMFSRSASSRTSSRPNAGHHHHCGLPAKGPVLLDPARGLQPVEARHPPIHEDDVERVVRRRAASRPRWPRRRRRPRRRARPRPVRASVRISRAEGLSSTTSALRRISSTAPRGRFRAHARTRT